MKCYQLIILLVLHQISKQKLALKVLFHDSYYLASKYFYNDVTFQFNKEYEYFKDQKMEIYLTDTLIAYSKQYHTGMDIMSYMQGGINYLALLDSQFDNLNTCCTRVSLIQMDQFLQQECNLNTSPTNSFVFQQQMQPYCLKLNTDSQYLFICHTDQANLVYLMKIINQQIIKHLITKLYSSKLQTQQFQSIFHQQSTQPNLLYQLNAKLLNAIPNKNNRNDKYQNRNKNKDNNNDDIDNYNKDNNNNKNNFESNDCKNQEQKEKNVEKKEEIKNIDEDELQLKYLIKNEVNCGYDYIWQFSRQNKWKCECKYGLFQSPINIIIRNTQQIKENTQLMIAFDDKLQQVIVKYENSNVFIYGDYGRIQHKYKDKVIIYYAYKIQFKFPAEHQIDFLQAAGEVLVYCKSKKNQEMIASFLINSKYGQLPNKLLNNLNIEMWPPWVEWNIKNNNEYKIQYEENSNKYLGLNQLYNQQKDWQSSFYWYQGSYSSPPCNQGVHRIVFEKPININQLTVQALKKYSFNSLTMRGGNSRNIQNADTFQDQRIIYYHKSTCEPIDEDFFKISDDKLQFKNTQLFNINQRIVKFFRTNQKKVYEGVQEGGEDQAGVYDHKTKLEAIEEEECKKQIMELPKEQRVKRNFEEGMFRKILSNLN